MEVSESPAVLGLVEDLNIAHGECVEDDWRLDEVSLC